MPASDKEPDAQNDTAVTTKYFNEESAYTLFSGEKLDAYTLAYESYGKLNKNKDNVILLFHALSGSQHVAGYNHGNDGNNHWIDDCQLGWWDAFVGPEKALNTNKFFVICANYLGGCYGSTGPSSKNPKTGKTYAADFPHLRFVDVARSQHAMLQNLGIKKVHAVVGASVGALLALSFATRYPEIVNIVIPIAGSLKISTLQKLVILEQILAIELDPNFNKGNYYRKKNKPELGLTLARMISHKTFISLKTMKRRARQELVDSQEFLSWYKMRDPIESYMFYQGKKFVQRFDPNTYLRILEMWSKFDLLEESGMNSYAAIFNRCQKQRYLVFSIDSDVCFYPDQQAYLVERLKECNIQAMHITVHSEKGHDSFLLEPELFTPHLSFVLEKNY